LVQTTQEAQKLLLAVAGKALPHHPPLEQFQSRKQRGCAVALTAPNKKRLR